MPSDTATTQWPYRLTDFATRARKAASSNTRSGNRMTCGASPSASQARPAAAAIQPAWRPITSNIKTLVEVSAIAATSKAASRMEVAIYLATEPLPGQVSVIGRSLSSVLGMPMQTGGGRGRAPGGGAGGAGAG